MNIPILNLGSHDDGESTVQNELMVGSNFSQLESTYGGTRVYLEQPIDESLENNHHEHYLGKRRYHDTKVNASGGDSIRETAIEDNSGTNHSRGYF